MRHQHNARNRGRSNPQDAAFRKVNIPIGVDEEESKFHGNATLRPWRQMMLSRPIMALWKRINKPMSPTSSSSWRWLAIAFFLSLSHLVGSSWSQGGGPLARTIQSLGYSVWDCGDRVHPRCVRHLIIDDGYYFTQSLNVNNNSSTETSSSEKERVVYVSKTEVRRQEYLENSEDYENQRDYPLETKHCKAQYPWQLSRGSPTCNSIHESDLNDLDAHLNGKVLFLANGHWRDVWVIRDHDGDESRRILKTLRYERQFTERTYGLQMRDAVAMERLAKSPLVVDIYGFCGNSGYFEYADGSDIHHTIWPKKHIPANLTSLHKLQIATQAAMGLADVHNIDKEGQPSIAHTDITPHQFVMVGGVFKINDFNCCKFLRWNKKEKRVCPYNVGYKNKGKNRSPEEYKYDPQSEKVDVYSLGNIFYMLLTGLPPFHGYDDEEASKKVMDGVRPSFSEAILKSPDPIVQTLKKAMFLCHEQDQKRRTKARHVAAILKEELLKHDPDALHRWGLQ